MVEFLQSLLKSKNPGLGESGENKICKWLYETYKDVLFLLLKLHFFNEISSKLKMIFSQSFRMTIQWLLFVWCFAADFLKEAKKPLKLMKIDEPAGQNQVGM